MAGGTRRRVMGKDKPPAPMVEIRNGRLCPVTGFDEREIDEFKEGTQFDLVVRQRRSLPQLRAYWAILSRVVEATGKWPSSRHLSNDLKLSLGYVTRSIDLKTKEVVKTPDSLAFTEMSPQEFGEYFDTAMAALTDFLGFDPRALQDSD